MRNAWSGEAKEKFKRRTKNIEWYSPIPQDRPLPTLDPLPKEHYTALIEAFMKGPKWEGYEPELSERIEGTAQKVIAELS